VTSSYNNVGELTGQSGSGADAATATRSFGYDTAGNLTSASTSNTLGTGSNATSEAFTYNDRGQVLTASGSAGSTTVTYNGDGQKASVADAAGTTSYTYDSAGRLGTLANPVTGTTGTYSYNSDSQVSGISYGTGNDTRSFGYDARHRLTSDTLKNPSGTAYASVSYGYNANSLITSETTTGLAGAASNTYTYDQAGRLASWNNGTTTTAYGYDANGNLTTSGAKSYTYDARDEMTGDGTGTYSYTARGTSSSEPGPSGSLAVTFDAYGDQATAGTRAYAYDALGRLTGDTLSGSGYAFSYVGSSGAMASDGSSTYAWDPSGGVLAGTGAAGGGTSGTLALTDIHGNLVGQFAAAGTALSASKAYDPWGNVVTGSVSGLLGYQSAWSDGAAGKDLMGARWYDPGAGDFTSADSVQVSPVPDPAAGNPFAYAADEPLDLTDPTGHYVDPGGSARTNPGYTDQVTYSLAYTAEVHRVGPAQARKAAAAMTARVHAAVKATNAQIAREQKAAAARAKQAQAKRIADGKKFVLLSPDVIIQKSDPYYGSMSKAIRNLLSENPGYGKLLQNGNINTQDWVWSIACHAAGPGACEPHFISQTVPGNNTAPLNSKFLISTALGPAGFAIVTSKSSSFGSRGAGLIPNKMPKMLDQELSRARQLGVKPASPGSEGFDAALRSGTVKWAVLEDGTLVVVPKFVNGVEIAHSVLSGGAPVRAVGEAEVAGSADTGYFGLEINNHSGHFLPPDESVQTGMNSFAEVGIEFP